MRPVKASSASSDDQRNHSNLKSTAHNQLQLGTFPPEALALDMREALTCFHSDLEYSPAHSIWTTCLQALLGRAVPTWYLFWLRLWT